MDFGVSSRAISCLTCVWTQEMGKVKKSTNSYNKYQQASLLSDLQISFLNPFPSSFIPLVSWCLSVSDPFPPYPQGISFSSLSSLILGGDIIRSTSHCRAVSFAAVPTIQLRGPARFENWLHHGIIKHAAEAKINSFYSVQLLILHYVVHCLIDLCGSVDY